eukprot:UN27988
MSAPVPVMQRMLNDSVFNKKNLKPICNMLIKWKSVCVFVDKNETDQLTILEIEINKIVKRVESDKEITNVGGLICFFLRHKFLNLETFIDCVKELTISKDKRFIAIGFECVKVIFNVYENINFNISQLLIEYLVQALLRINQTNEPEELWDSYCSVIDCASEKKFDLSTIHCQIKINFLGE